MTNREAIASLKTLCNTCTMFPKCVNDKPECFQAIETAISALEKQEQDRWIPVTERLPEPRIDVWCNSDLGQMVGYYDEIIETWYGRDYLELIVTAWRPLPEPYTEDEAE